MADFNVNDLANQPVKETIERIIHKEVPVEVFKTIEVTRLVIKRVVPKLIWALIIAQALVIAFLLHHK
jgi:hypothetical protein